MDLVTIALIIGAVWIGVLVVVLAMCKASGHADADEERDMPAGSPRRRPVPPWLAKLRGASSTSAAMPTDPPDATRCRPVSRIPNAYIS